MPNRILRDWTRSEKVNLLSCEAERFFTRLIMRVDDYGCFHAHPSILKGELYILKLNQVRETDISRWMAECQKAGLIALYESERKQYLQIIDFRQRLDRAKRKYPLPEIGIEIPPESEARKEVESEAGGPPLDLGVVCYDAEKEILKNPIAFEQIVLAAKKTDLAAAKISLRKYHLYLQEKEQYPKGRKAVFAGFEKWLLNEHKFSNNGTHQRTSKPNSKSSGAEQLLASLKDDLTGSGNYSG